MITDTQRQQRIQGLGSSDAAAVLGFNPWRTAADVRLEKLGLLEPEQESSELAEIGTALEAGIADLASKRLGVRLVKPTATFHHGSGILLANPDRLVDAPRRGQPVVEIKDSGIDEDWGEPGTDQVPPYVLIQVCHQLVCVGSDEAHVARLGRGFKRGLYLYEIRRDGEVARLCDALERKLPEWWQRHIVNRDPLPEGSDPPSMDVLKRLRREPETWTDLPDELVAEWQEAEKYAKEMADAADELKRRVIAALDKCEGGRCSLGSVTFLTQKRKGYTVADTEFRVCRYKPAKK